LIAQHLNRDFVLGTAEASAAEIDRLLAQRADGVGGAPSPLDDVCDEDLAHLAGWLRQAVSRADEEREEGEPEQVGESLPPPKDDYVFMPRKADLGLVQVALDEYAESELEIEEQPMLDDRRSGLEPVTTDRRIADLPLQLTPEGRRAFGRMEVTRPKVLSDPRWILSLVEQMKAHGRKPPFPCRPGAADLGERARVVLVGDWGSGLRRALRVGAQMAAALRETPDGYARHLVHLGDVYYSGTAREYRQRFLAPWPAKGDLAETPSYALNGNHDMYSGGFAYFSALANDARFAGQGGASHFRLASDHWQLLGLDTSFADKDLHGEQARWAQEAISGFRGHTVLLSHHQLFSPYEETAPGLRAKMEPVLRATPATGWFWAHEHRCLVYRGHDLVRFASCVGHGGIPEYLIKERPIRPTWFEYEYRKRHSTDWQPWNTFGFAVLDIHGPDRATVRYVDEDGCNHYTTEVLQPWA
jgi:Calcineurin-like phosphoesterase